jgi:hypothetical protein
MNPGSISQRLLALPQSTRWPRNLRSHRCQIIASEGATVASTVTYLLPVVAIVLGVLVLGETVTAAALADIALVLAGVALTRRREKAAVGEQSQ